MTKFPDVEVALTGEDGNAFSIIGRVSRAMKQSGYRDEAAAFTKEAMSQPSYDALLALVMRTVSVT